MKKLLPKPLFINVCFVLLTAAMLLLVVYYDRNYYIRHLPERPAIEAVTVSKDAFRSSAPYFRCMYPVQGALLGDEFETEDPDAIDAMLALHRHVLENVNYERPDRNVCQICLDGWIHVHGFGDTEEITFSYIMKDGFRFRRTLHIPVVDADTLALIDQVIHTQSYQAFFTLEHQLDASGIELSALSLKTSDIHAFAYHNDVIFSSDEQNGIQTTYHWLQVTDPSQVRGIIQAMDQDALEKSYADKRQVYRAGQPVPYIEAKMTSVQPIPEGAPLHPSSEGEPQRNGGYDYYTCNVDFTISKDDRHTIAYLKEIGVLAE